MYLVEIQLNLFYFECPSLAKRVLLLNPTAAAVPQRNAAEACTAGHVTNTAAVHLAGGVSGSGQ